MASFPDSPHTFTDFANSALSDAAQVTSIYDEVEAIEAGYLNGSARLNSSHSTVVALSVTGGSTLTTLTAGNSTVANLSVSSNSTITGSLSVVGNSTFDGNLTVSGTFTASGGFTPTAPHVIASRGSTQAVGSTDWIAVNWDTALVDSDSMLSTSANSSRLTCVASSGMYLVTACVGMSKPASAADSRFVARIYVNDSSQATQAQHSTAYSAFANAAQLSMSALIRAADTNTYVTLQVRQIDAGSTTSILADSTGVTTRMTAHLVSI